MNNGKKNIDLRVLDALAKCESRGSSAALQDISRFESDIGRPLPSETRLFFSLANGCVGYGVELYSIDDLRRNLYGDLKVDAYDDIADEFLIVGANYSSEYIVRKWDESSDQYWLIPMIDMTPCERIELADGLPNLLEVLVAE